MGWEYSYFSVKQSNISAELLFIIILYLLANM